MTTAPPACPECGTPIEPHWDWCHGCGFDPDGLRPNMWVPDPAAQARMQAPPPGVPAPVMAAPGVDDSARPPFSPGGRGPAESTSAPRPPRRGHVGAIVRTLIVVVVALGAIGAVAYVVLHNKMDNQKTLPSTPAFASGLALVFTNSDPGSQPVNLPNDLPGCVQAKLDAGDVAAISTLQVPQDTNNLSANAQVDAFRAARTCDRVGLAQAMSSQGNLFNEYGVNSIARQQCVNEHVIDLLADLDPTQPLSQASIDQQLETAFQNCVPITAALKALAESATPPPSDDQAECIADQMAQGTSWAQIWALSVANPSPAIKAAFEQSIRAALATCPP
jgi:hypothetical protein